MHDIGKDVTEYLKTYCECQTNKPSYQKTQGMVQPLEVSAHRSEPVIMDIITHLPQTKAGDDSLLTIADYLTKIVVIRRIYYTTAAVDIAKFLWTRW